jgi:hypothetical protein
VVPADFERVLWYTSIGAQLLLAARLVSFRLACVYPAFTLWLTVDAAKSLVLLFLPFASAAYAYSWIYSQPIVLALQAWAVAEAYSHTTRAYPVLGSFGRWVLSVGLTIAIIVAAVPVASELGTATGYGSIHRFIGFMLKRVVMSGLAVFLLVVLAAFAVVPIPERSNVKLHRILLTAYQIVHAAAMLYVTTAGPHVVAWSSLLILGSSVLFYGTWIMGITREGEIVNAPPLPPPEEIDRAEAYLAEGLPMLKEMALHPWRRRRPE